MYEIRLHGLGGEGVVTLSEMIGKSATRCGSWAHSFPFFGTEVRGAPVKAFTRVSDTPIHVKSYIYEPDLIVITNDTLLADPEVLHGLKPEGFVLINTALERRALTALPSSRTLAFNASEMAAEIFGRPIVNTLLFGALIGLTDLFPLDTAREIVAEEFPGKRAAWNNLALSKGFETARKGS